MLEGLLIAGLGSIGRRLVPLARKVVPGAHVAMLRHRNCQELPAIGIDHFVTSLEDALQFRPQAPVIANPASCRRVPHAALRL